MCVCVYIYVHMQEMYLSVCVCVCIYVHMQEDLPAHPAMRLAYNCEDVLSMKLSRRLITMVKLR
jgi:hypothetical protein